MRTGHAIAAAVLLLTCGAPAGAAQEGVRVFAPGVVSVEGQSVYRGAFSPDGREFYFFRKVTQGREDYRIFVTRRSGDGGWGEPRRVELGGDHSDLYPTLSPDGRRMVFSSYRDTPDGATLQANLWYADRQGDGWGEPVYLPTLSDRQAYNPGPSYDPDGWLRYKAEVWGPVPSREHLRARFTAQGFGTPERDPLLDPFEGWREGIRIWDGTLSPDGTLLVLGVSELDPASGQAAPSDLFLSRRQGEKWSEPIRLGPAVNTPGWENFVVFTPDGDELLFGREFSTYHAVPVASLPGS